MPSARPIITIMFVTKIDSGNALLSSVAAAVASRIASPASSSGSSAATTAPNTSTRITSATGSTRVSVSRSLFAISSKVCVRLPKPPVTTVKPSLPSRPRSTSISGPTCSEAASMSPTNFVGMSVVCPSPETSSVAPTS